MLIAGANGHAIELLGILDANGFNEDVFFFDDLNVQPGLSLFNRYKILTDIKQVKAVFKKAPNFILGVGNPASRKLLTDKMAGAGGKLISLISDSAFIGKHDVIIGQGVNIMQGVVITERCRIGNGTLVHVHCSIHHDTVIGEYCELSPGCRILGRAQVGSFVSVGAGAVVLPDKKIGNNAVIGAGAVVTKDVPEGLVVVGVPAKPLCI